MGQSLGKVFWERERSLFFGPGNMSVLARAPSKLGMHGSMVENRGWWKNSTRKCFLSIKRMIFETNKWILNFDFLLEGK